MAPFTGQHAMKANGFTINRPIMNLQLNEYFYCKWLYFQVNGQVADIPFSLFQGKIEVSFIYCSLTALKTEPMWNVTTDSQNEYPLLAPASPISKTIVDVVGTKPLWRWWLYFKRRRLNETMSAGVYSEGVSVYSAHGRERCSVS